MIISCRLIKKWLLTANHSLTRNAVKGHYTKKLGFKKKEANSEIDLRNCRIWKGYKTE